MAGRMIRASEIAAFVYCRRSWWYARQGLTPAWSGDLDAGLEWHHQHARLVVTVSRTRRAGAAALLIAAVLTVAVLTGVLGG